MGKKELLHELSSGGLELVAKRFRALGEPSRLKLMLELADGEKNVGSLVAACKLTQANASRHLQTLTTVGLLTRRKDGSTVLYKVSEPSIFEFCTAMCGGLRKHLEGQARAMA